MGYYYTRSTARTAQMRQGSSAVRLRAAGVRLTWARNLAVRIRAKRTRDVPTSILIGMVYLWKVDRIRSSKKVVCGSAQYA